MRWREKILDAFDGLSQGSDLEAQPDAFGHVPMKHGQDHAKGWYVISG